MRRTRLYGSDRVISITSRNMTVLGTTRSERLTFGLITMRINQYTYGYRVKYIYRTYFGLIRRFSDRLYNLRFLLFETSTLQRVDRRNDNVRISLTRFQGISRRL